MAKPEREYRKLPGRGLRHRGNLLAIVRTTCTLCMAKDHLLSIDSMGGYTEDYKRFYFRDVQAIMIRKSDRGKVLALIFGFLAGMCGLMALLVSDPGWRIFWLILVGIFLLIVLVNWLLGPTCVCHLRTAVQTEELPSLNRMRTARKVVARLKPAIEQAQGTVTSDEVPARIREMITRQAQSATTAPPATRSFPVARAQAVSPYNGRAHAILFGLLLLDAVRIGIDFFVDHVLIATVEMALVAGVLIGVIVALTRQQPAALTAGLRRLTWGVLVYIVAGVVIGFMQYIIIMVEHAGSRRVLNESDVFRIYAETSPFDSLWLMCTMIFSLVCSLGFGLGGLFLFRQYRLAATVPPPVVPAGGPTEAKPD